MFKELLKETRYHKAWMAQWCYWAKQFIPEGEKFNFDPTLSEADILDKLNKTSH